MPPDLFEPCPVGLDQRANLFDRHVLHYTTGSAIRDQGSENDGAHVLYLIPAPCSLIPVIGLP